MSQALRTSAYFRPRPAATVHCSVKSGEISSMNPDRVHMGIPSQVKASRQLFSR